jgi:hypothetical protein
VYTALLCRLDDAFVEKLVSWWIFPVDRICGLT